jgi:hypothetical protein
LPLELKQDVYGTSIAGAAASRISTAPTTTTTGYNRSQTKTGKLQLWLDEKNGAGQGETTNQRSMPLMLNNLRLKLQSLPS